MTATYAKLLRDPRWKKFRAQILELDGASCATCGASGKLHVHHKEYLAGRLPWEYPPDMLESLCAGCHAAEHGKIPPQTGWTLVAEDDLGEIGANCELCDEPIRYVFSIYHPEWGFTNVGTNCCDRLTGTVEASERERRMKRRLRFIESRHWRRAERCSKRKFGDFYLYVFRYGHGFRLRMSGYGASVLGSRIYDTERLARAGAFDAIVSGAAAETLRRAARTS